MKKTRIAILFGGKSAEHEVSIQSAKNVFEALDKDKYDVELVGISKKGEWHRLTAAAFIRLANAPSLPPFTLKPHSAPLVPSLSVGIDIVFPVLHGPNGEDGSVQGMLKILNVPFVGSDVLGSAIGMDKDVAKRLLRDAGLPIARFLVLKSGMRDSVSFSELTEEFGLPFFVKPANLGSSVGVAKVANEKQYKAALAGAFSYDTKILIEECIVGRELECSVLGNDIPIASTVGEIIVKSDFYSYDAKYVDEKSARMQIPAIISDELEKKIKDYAVQVFEILCCNGMGRVDFFLTKEGNIYINEINTIPGFTNISMYPALWEASGLTYGELVDRLVQLALERYHQRQLLRSSV